MPTPPKNKKIHKNLCLLTYLYPLLLRLYPIKEIIQNLEKHILSNGAHLVSPHWAQKLVKAPIGVTVKPYIISFFYRHPVCF